MPSSCTACSRLWEEFCRASVDEFRLKEEMRLAMIAHSDITSVAMAIIDLKRSGPACGAQSKYCGPEAKGSPAYPRFTCAPGKLKEVPAWQSTQRSISRSKSLRGPANAAKWLISYREAIQNVTGQAQRRVDVHRRRSESAIRASCSLYVGPAALPESGSRRTIRPILP